VSQRYLAQRELAELRSQHVELFGFDRDVRVTLKDLLHQQKRPLKTVRVTHQHAAVRHHRLVEINDVDARVDGVTYLLQKIAPPIRQCRRNSIHAIGTGPDMIERLVAVVINARDQHARLESLDQLREHFRHATHIEIHANVEAALAHVSGPSRPRLGYPIVRVTNIKSVVAKFTHAADERVRRINALRQPVENLVVRDVDVRL